MGRVRHHLVGHEADSIVVIDQLEQIVHVTVQLLLPGSKGPASRILRPEEGRQ